MTLSDRIEHKDARVAVVGQGYVGLPLAVGFHLSGPETDREWVDVRKASRASRMPRAGSSGSNPHGLIVFWGGALSSATPTWAILCWAWCAARFFARRFAPHRSLCP